METSSPEEWELLKRCIEGDRKSFTALYTRYTPMLYRLLYPLTHESKHDTEEIIQDIFLSIWEKRAMLLTVRSFQPFIFRMARNRLIDQYRKGVTRKRIAEGPEIQQMHPATDPSADLLYTEYHAIALKAIDTLPPRQKQIFLMRTQEEMPLNEIAEKLSISLAAVKKQLYAAIGSVKTILRQEGEWCVLLFVLVNLF